MSCNKTSDMNGDTKAPQHGTSDGKRSKTSSYFQTEFYSSCGSRHEKSKLLPRKQKSTLELEFSAEEVATPSGFAQRHEVNSGTQVSRSIVGQEDGLPKERKKWIRPPLVGQASNTDDNVLPARKVTCSTDSEEEKPHFSNPRSHNYQELSVYFSSSEQYPNRKDYITEKPPEGSSDQSLPNLSDQNDSQKIPSPSSASASSITSRGLLEWDSSADFGYYQYSGNPNKEQKLSTLEKLALAKGCASLLTRSDPEGTTGTKQPVKPNSIGIPTAQSTPLNTLAKSSDPLNLHASSDKKDYHPLFPEAIINRQNKSGGNKFREKTIGGSESDFTLKDNPVISKKLSSSLEHMSDKKNEDVLASTFPRSHSQNNINMEFIPASNSQKVLLPTKSNSSSSVATVVTNKNTPRKTSRFVQTSYMDTSVGVQVSFSHLRSNSLPTHSHNGVPCSGAHPKLPPRIVTPDQGRDRSTDVNFSTLESGQLSSEDRANSFEYLPGHIYENVVVRENSSKGSSKVVHEIPTEDDKLWDRSGDNTLKRDVERGFNLLSEFVRGSKAQDNELKKKLIKRVVEKLINTEYPGDSESFNWMDEQQAPRADERCQISGESTEKSETISSPSSKSSKNHVDKCIGTRNSTSLSGYSESTEKEITISELSSIRSKDSIQQSSVNSVPRPKFPRSNPFQNDDSSDRSDWRRPTTKAEELYERKKKKENSNGEAKLLKYLNSERENQLFWIKSEIDHLSNLKKLLEKHESLKKNLNSLKMSRQRLERPAKKLSSNSQDPGKVHRRRETLREMTANGNQVKSPQSILTTSSEIENSKESGWNSHNYSETDREKKPRVIPPNKPSVPRINKRDASTETLPPHEGVHTKNASSAYPKPLAFSIVFDQKNKYPPSLVEKKTKANRKGEVMVSLEELHKAIDEILGHRGESSVPDAGTVADQKFVTDNCPTLQDYLVKNRPLYVLRAEERRKILSELADYREMRHKRKKELLVAATLPGDVQNVIPDLPAPPLAIKRIVSQKNMRRQTEKRYRCSAEVRNKQVEMKRREAYRMNKLMAEVFNKKLQKKTLKGEVNLSNSVSVISNL